MDAVIPAAIIAVTLTAAAIGAAYLWFTDRDEKRAGYLKPSEPPSNCTIFVGPWPPRVVPDEEEAS